ncbi:MAG TPA: hypothetical protein VIY71_09840 [Solirubrobacterales bacterium]
MLAMACAAALLIWEDRGLTLLLDEWSWGFGGRTNLDPHAFVDPHNGHFVAVLVLITKAALQMSHADAALPLRLLSVALHLAVGGCLFLLMRKAIGTVAAVMPTVLVLFLGAANDVIIGSHSMSVTITVLVGLAAWLAIERNRLAWDVVAAGLLTIGVATASTVLPFVVGAAALIGLDRKSTRSRYWVALFPFAVYVLWWLAWGHTEKSDVAIANVAGLPSFAFDSLAAALASITGLFTIAGSRTAGFDLSAGQALAGGLLVVLLGLVVSRRFRPGVASLAPLLTLLSFWLLTSAVASQARAPSSSRYLYISVILLLLVFAQEIGAAPFRRRAALALSAICAFALLPNIREITYAADGIRVQAEANRAVMGAADLVIGEAPGDTLLEDSADVVGVQSADLAFSLETYAASRQRFGAPAFSVGRIEAAGFLAHAAADHFLARALSIEVVSASTPPGRLPVALGVVQTGGTTKRVNGCLRFIPLADGALLNLKLPVGGLWIRPAAGSPVPVRVERFDESFGVSVSAALGGRASKLTLPATRASDGWRAQFDPTQPLLLCAA